ncbi:MAG: DUF4988 domain-containing protein [Tannerellaceae bacterium]|jgi:hypothetical protein|nr:DUF4988 domain-containing protein [Tannerellaceae bacterium]
MSAKKIKSILFYLIPLGLLFSYIFTTCYGADIDYIDDRLTTVETQLKEIQDKIAAGKVIASVTAITGGFTITFTDGTSYSIVNGAPGATGATGAPGTEWIIQNGYWYNNTTKTETSYRAIGANAPSPKISKDGYWILYNWNEAKKDYEPDTTDFVADVTVSYMVDYGTFYRLYVPEKKEDESGNIIKDEDGRDIVTWRPIDLPKHEPNPIPTLVFKFLGYARVVGNDDTADTVQMKPDDLNLTYWYLNDISYDGTSVSEGHPMWKWRPRDEGELEVNKFSVIELKNDSSYAAVVFSINRPKDYITKADTKFQLKDTKGQILEAIKLDRPILFEGGLITKAGSNEDSVYYARMRSPEYPYQPEIQKEKAYYRLVIDDTIHSELSPYPILLSHLYPTPLPEATVDSVMPGNILTTTDTVLVPYNPVTRYSFKLNRDSLLFDHYIGTDSPRIDIPQETAFKRFRIDTLLAPGERYTFPINVYKLQKDGVIYVDTILIRTEGITPPPVVP